MIKKISSPVKIILKTKEGIKGISKLVTAPIPWISAPIFNVIAGKLNIAIRYKILFFKCCCHPSCVTIPIRAHISCTAAIKGKVIIAVQRVVKPKPAPACIYVAIPEGSSSLAPVISPGPSISSIF
jgi:hypothetical protein